MKRTLLITGAVLGAILFAGLGFYFRSGGSAATSVTETPSSGGSAGGLPATTGASGGDSPSSAPKELPVSPSAPSELLAYFVRPDKSIVAIGPDGKITLTTDVSSTLITTQPISNILSASFSSDGKKVLVKASKTDTLSPYWSSYDIDKNTWRQLSIDARDAVFSPQGETVAYLSRRTSGITLTTLDLSRDAAKPVGLVALAAEDLSLAWMDPSTLLLAERPSGNVPGSLWSVDVRTHLMKHLSDASGMETSWGKNSGLLFTAGQNGGTLSLVGKDALPNQTLALLTLPSKCVFYSAASSSEALLCGIPRDTRAFRQASLPEDYLMGTLMTSDDLVSIDLLRGIVTPVMNDPAKSFDVTNLSVSGDTAYFVNRWDHKLYKQSLH
jgi:hypothetical protein